MALIRWWSPDVLFRPDRSWWRLWLLIVAGSCGGVYIAGRMAADALGRFMSTRLGEAPLTPFPLSRTALVTISVVAVVTGTFLRIAWLADPPPLFSDEVTLISPTLALEASLRDFLPPYRGVPYGIEKPWGSVGVVYLEVFRGALRTFGVNAAGLRVTSVFGGVASLLTAALLARALLPAGGGALAALVLAGLRWHLIMSSWGWVAICVTPVLDLAAWFLVRGRVKRSGPFTIAAGILAGIGGHIYLAGWVGFGALLVFRLWPVSDGETRRHRVVHAAIFAVAFLGSVLPLFVLAGEGESPYFARVRSHNLLREFRLRQSAHPFSKRLPKVWARPGSFLNRRDGRTSPAGAGSASSWARWWLLPSRAASPDHATRFRRSSWRTERSR